MHRVLNWKRLLVVVGLLVVLSAAAYGVHSVQARRHSTALKERAEKAEADAGGDPAKTDEAIDLYERYLRFRPNDGDAALKHARLVMAQAKADPKKAGTGADAAEKFLRQFPDNPEERRALIGLYLQLGKINSARQHLEMMFNSAKGDFRQDVDLLEKAAACEQAAGNVGEAIDYLERALKTGKATLPVAVRIYERLLVLHNRNTVDQLREAKIAAHMNTLLHADPYKTDVSARVVAARFQLMRGESKNARDNITHALTAMPGGATNADVLIAAAELELSEARTPDVAMAQLKKAEAHLQGAFDRDPKDARVGLLLADILAKQGNGPKAVEVLTRTADALGEVNDRFLDVVDRLIDYAEQKKSADLVARMEKDDTLRLMTKYYRGRLAVLAKDWGKARQLLDEVAPQLITIPERHKRAVAGLGRCYEVLQNPDKQLENYRAARKDDPNYLPAIVGEAEALAKLGRYREALPLYNALVNAFKIEAFRPTLVRLELVALMGQPAGSRNWSGFDAALGPETARTPEIKLLHAEALAARDDKAGAVKLLEELAKDNPTYTPVWSVLVRIRDAGKPEGVLTQLEALEKQHGDTVAVRLTKAALLVRRAKKPSPDEFRAIGAGSEKFDAADRHRLWFGLGDSAVLATASQPDQAAATAMRAAAVEFFRNAADADPLDLMARAVLIDLGVTAGRSEIVQRALAETAAVEGPNGPIGALGRVAVRLPEVRRMEDKAARSEAVKELRELATRAKDSRPGWSRVYIALAQLDELDGLNDAALTNYLAAIDKGDRQEFVIRRVYELYLERRQDDLAAALLNRLHTEVVLPDDLERFRSIKDLLARDLPRSERPTIDRIAPASSKDHRILLLRGALLSAIRDDDEALKSLRAAVELGTHVPETWTSLVAHLFRVGQEEEARKATAQFKDVVEKVLAEGTGKTEVERADLALALAGCYELTNDPKAAEVWYRRAVTVAPRELNPIRQLVFFLQRTARGPEAEKTLRALAEDPAQNLARWARRHLALTLLAGRNGYANRHEAMRLVERNLAADPNEPEDQKAKAVVQTADPATRAEAVKALKEFAKWHGLTPDEYYLLAKMHFDQGKVVESVEYFEKAARPQAGVTLEHLGGLFRVYLALNQVEPARKVLARMKSAAPKSWMVARDEARFLHRLATDASKAGNKEEAAKHDAEARELILKFVETDPAHMIAGGNGAGALLEELGFLADAEALFTRLLTISQEPGAHLPLAVYLINRKRTGEAVALARKYEGRSSPVVTARILTGAIRARSPGKDVEKQVEDWLAAKLKEFAGKPEYPVLVGCRAELYDAQGRYDEAIAEYRRAVELDRGRSELAVNNLCMLLALHGRDRGQVDEAVRLMTELIGVNGPAPVFLDTRAVAYLVSGRPVEAAADLELALIQQRKPAYLFHMAWANDLIIEKRVFRDQLLEEAKKAGLSMDDLHPLEEKKYRELTVGR